jgi:hypothetical protein
MLSEEKSENARLKL